MDTTPLVIDEIEAGREFLKLLHAYRPVKAACWLREEENEERYLHAALEGLTTEETGKAYLEVRRLTEEMKDHYLDPFRVKLIGTDHPVAKALLDIYQRYPGPVPTRPDGRVFAGMSPVEVYIYRPIDKL